MTPDDNQLRLVTVALKDVKPNPFRDLPNYKLDERKVAGLVASINSTGFWSNVVGRINAAGEFELAYGHHRIAAARRVLGDDHAQRFIAQPFSDVVMLRMMADENSDKWSNAVEHANLVVKAARDFLDNLFEKYETLDNLINAAEFGNVASLFDSDRQYKQVRRDGVGRTVIQRFLGGTFAKGKDVENALANIPLSPKQRATKEREIAARRELQEELQRQEEAEKARLEQEGRQRAAAVAAAKAERLKMEKERRRVAEETKRINERLRKARDRQAKAEREKNDHARRQAETERRAAEQAQIRAQQAERLAEAARKEAEEAEERAARQAEEQDKARQQREAEIMAAAEKLRLEEAADIARLAQDGRYDIKAGELFGVQLHTRTFREIVTSDRAVKAGVILEDQYRIAQEILERYGPGDSLNAAMIRGHLFRLIEERELKDYAERERRQTDRVNRDKIQALAAKINRSVRDAALWMSEIAAMLPSMDEEFTGQILTTVLQSHFEYFDRSRQQFIDAVDARNKRRVPNLTVIDNSNRKDKESGNAT